MQEQFFMMKIKIVLSSTVKAMILCRNKEDNINYRQFFID